MASWVGLIFAHGEVAAIGTFSHDYCSRIADQCRNARILRQLANHRIRRFASSFCQFERIAYRPLHAPRLTPLITRIRDADRPAILAIADYSGGGTAMTFPSAPKLDYWVCWCKLYRCR